MSKESKPADLWRHVFAAAQDRPDSWCKGCGYHRVVHGTHRADCAVQATAEERRRIVADRLRELDERHPPARDTDPDWPAENRR